MEQPEQSSSTSSVTQQKLPDYDTIKLFIGQIPRTYTEVDCTKLLEEFGPIYQLNVHRDKKTGESKGCCFVTFYHRADAIKVQDALHNTRILPGMHNAMQVKPADAENRNERKLFVGMIGKNTTEEDIKKLFDPFGTIEEVTILRDSTTGKSRGCAFVTFVSRSCAHQAIKQMHQSTTFEGCSKPMVVKLADNSKEKDGKKDSESPNDTNILQILQNAAMQGNVATQLTSLGMLLQNPNVATLLGTVIASLTPNASGMSSTSIEGSSAGPSNSSKKGGNHGESSGPALLQQQQLTALQQQQQYLELIKQQQQQQQLDLPYLQTQLSLNSIIPTSTPTLLSHINPLCTTTPSLTSTGLSLLDPNLVQRTLPILSTGVVDPNLMNKSNNSGNITKGPDGCNLFIYHLPQDMGDEDLKNLFSHFGTVLSAKVYVDKVTNLSKCFGFVSFDNSQNAQNAINGMNGFQIGAKRLKVTLKKSAEKPYDKP